MPRKPAAPKKKTETRTPAVGIGVVVWREDKVLLVKRGNAPRKGQWSLPGGKQEWGETIMHAAAREVREETGLDITPFAIITAVDGIGEDFHYTIVEVAADALEGEPKAQDDAVDVRWATLDEVEKLCEWPEVARVVRLSMLQRAL